MKEVKAVRMWIGGEMDYPQLRKYETIQKANFCMSLDKAIEALSATATSSDEGFKFNDSRKMTILEQIMYWHRVHSEQLGEPTKLETHAEELLYRIRDTIAAQEKDIAELVEIAKVVAQIGVDFEYGNDVIEDKHIGKAAELLAKHKGDEG